MEDLAADFIIENNQPLELDAEISEPEHFDCSFELYAAGTTWGSISGTLSNQTDLQDALDLKADKTDVESVTGALADSISTVADNLQSETTTRADNDVILQNNINALSDSLTAEISQRASADTILQGNINALDDKVDSLTGALDDRIDTLSDTVTANYNSLDDKIDSINGALTDSIEAVDDKYNSITGGLADSITAIDNTIDNFGDIVNYNAADFADSAQGALADTALQPNDNISELNNDVGYITSASLPTVNNSSIIFQKNGTNFDTITLNQSNNDTINISVPTTAAEVNALPDTTTINDLTTPTQQAALNSGANTTNIGQIATNTNAISTEVTNRQNADIALQNQIDAIVSSSDVFDIVGTYAELQAYDISTVPVNDIIKVLVDSTHNNAATYYRCVETGGVKSWSYIGSEGAYYTKGEADAAFVPQTRTVNGKALSNNVSLTASDVGALPDSTVIPTVNNSTITIQKNGAAVDTFTLNQATAKTINITIPTDTSDLTNGAGFISGISYADVIAALGYTPYNNTNPNGYITSAALNGYATENFVTSQGYITGINSTDVINALGYTPYSSSNPDGFITSAALTNYVTTDTAQNITGVKTFVGQKMIAFKQSTSSNKLGFTLYNNNNVEKGYLEFNPTNTIDGAPLMTLGNYATATAGLTHIGFRKYSSISGASGAYNLLAPLISDARTPFNLTTTYTNFYLPLGFTDGNTTVLTAKTGLVDISSLLPDISTKQDTLVSGTNIKTINNTSLLGSGNIDTSEIFVATYGTTTYNEIASAVSVGKFVFLLSAGNSTYLLPLITIDNIQGALFYGYVGGGVTYVRSCDTSDNWSSTSGTLGTVNSVNNTSPDNSGNVTLAIPDTSNLANKDLSNLSATGKTVIDGQWVQADDQLYTDGAMNGSPITNRDLSAYLPDNDKYLVLFCAEIKTAASSNSNCAMQLSSDICGYTKLCEAVTRTNAANWAMGSVWLPVSNRRMNIYRTTSYSGTFNLWIRGYRKMGTNA